MSLPAPPNTGLAVQPEPEDDPTFPDAPPEEEFWEKHNKRLEFPIGAVGAVLFHVLVAVVIIALWSVMSGGDDHGSVPLILVDAGGFDDAGSGSEGSGGTDEPIPTTNKDPFATTDPTNITPDIPSPQDPKSSTNLVDPTTGQMPLPNPSSTPKRSERGEGKEKGSGYEGTKGKGPGGSGSDSTRARNQRWTIRFKVTDARDYLNQLQGMKGEILIPIPGEEGKFWYFPDLSNPSSKHIATDADKSKLAGQVKFCDTRTETAKEMARALGVDFTPKEFWAFFPKDLEDELERKERSYRNRQPEQIERTIFRVVIRGGGYDVMVDDQILKK